MRNKPRVSITLHPRGKNSLGENRQRLGFSAFHWGILVSPKNPISGIHTHFDVTDSLNFDHETEEAKEDWRFRERTDAEPDLAFQILGKVIVGKVTPAVLQELRGRLRELPLPENGVKRGGCVSWTRSGIEVLKEMRVLEASFNVDVFMEAALAFADDSLRGGTGLGCVLDYTSDKRV
ncbi:hypothetical protein BJX70DRAFT_372279 [Aspergillus crustosus]